MKIIADLHIHSHFSRATSRDLNFEQLTRWAQLKGVHIVGTGDIAHPGWLKEMQEKLEPAEDGLFRLKQEYLTAIQKEVPKACQAPVRFMLAGEISNIYKKNERVRKIHNVVFLPSFEAVEKFQARLDKIGNIHSDGRPILGLDARDLLEIVLETDPRAYLIPAHIWTPWFSLFGSKSGFDSIEECFEDLTPHIFALETGLSSDPPMNWRWSALDRFTLVSNSDAHSPAKLAREANIFETELSYQSLFDALKSGDPNHFKGTIEFFPEEGKYHYDGHRKCGICWDPRTTLQHQGICPVCGKPVTVGVMHRVELLADREEGEKPERVAPFYSLIPLPEIISEVLGVGPSSKRVKKNYEQLLSSLGSELYILMDAPLEDIRRYGSELLAEGIRRMRAGEIVVKAGYDGEYGLIKVLEEETSPARDNEINLFGESDVSISAPLKVGEQLSLFSVAPPSVAPGTESSEPPFSPAPATRDTEEQEHHQSFDASHPGEAPTELTSAIFAGLNPQQRKAVQHTRGHLLITAGPGTGKTRTLTHRIAYLISEQGISPENILAITFTNKATNEMEERLLHLLGTPLTERITVKTFHAFGTMVLRAHSGYLQLPEDFTILGEKEALALLKSTMTAKSDHGGEAYLRQISLAKQRLLGPDSPELEEFSVELPDFSTVYRVYQNALEKFNCVDFDDLLRLCVTLWEKHPEILQEYRRRYRWISVDEYQDINFAQYQLLRLLVTPQTNLCVIGDPDQAIYGFRGASRDYFLKFKDDFPDVQEVQLQRNYRSSQTILLASGQVIAASADRITPNIWSDIVTQTRIEIHQAPTHKAEAEYVVHEVEKMVGGTSYFSLDSGRVAGEEEVKDYSFSDFAVLYRLNALNRDLKEAFSRSGIPFQVVGETPIYERPEIREILSCLWLILRPSSQFHQQYLRERLGDMESFLDTLRPHRGTTPVVELIQTIHSELQRRRKISTSKAHLESIQKLERMAETYGANLLSFLDNIMLRKKEDEYDPRADRVSLMTLHASKGLEFPVVFIIGCENNLLPYRQNGKESDEEEERRLLYVGMTRAQHKLILTYANKRLLFGKTMNNPPSPFLTDIENTLKEFKKSVPSKSPKKKKDGGQLSLF
ncbi:MAG: hypothetical protein D6748_05220 [Calditrichaeota bacterium]|nr:MAG: hypothetical protein D6748_05220 [Calditrichota bacterium]